MMLVLLRVVCGVLGSLVMFALWIAAVLIPMPRPPVPPSLALTLTAPVMTAAGCAIGIHLIERLTRARPGSVRGTFLWTLAGGELGALITYGFGGMMAGFGILGCGAAALVAREWHGRE